MASATPNVLAETPAPHTRRRQTTVERAVSRGTLTKRQGLAADKLYLHWCRADMAGREAGLMASTAFLDADLLRACGIHDDLPDGEDAEIVRSAIKKVQSNTRGYSRTDVAWVLEFVVCRNLTFEQAGLQARLCNNFIGRRCGRNSAEWSAIFYVTNALNILADEWGIPE